MKKPLFMLGLLINQVVFAGVQADLDGFFNDLGYMSNTTSPGVYNSQAAGSYAGGSLLVKNPIKDYSLIQLDLPSYRAGCGGIDLHMGSMSFISKDNMQALGKSIMTNGTSYAFDLAMVTTVPEMKHTKDILQQAEQFANNASINSCEMGQTLVGGIWPKTLASQDKICKDQGTLGKEGYFNDYVSARMECSGNKRAQAIQAAKNNPKARDQVVYNKNLVWSLLKSKSFLASNDELCEMMMSLTGTIIIDDNGHVKNVPSLANSSNLLKALIGGGAESGDSVGKIWKCASSDSDCLSVNKENLVIHSKNTLRAKVDDILYKIQTSLKDSEPNPEDVNKIASFASMVHIPVVKFTEVLMSTEYGDSIVDLSDFSTLIAQDLLQKYLNELLQEVSNTTRSSELPEDLIKEISSRIQMARNEVAKLDPEIGKKLEQKFMLINNIRQIEQQVATRVAQELG